MTCKKITKKSAGTVQLSLDVTPQSKELLEALRKKFELKTKTQAFEIILERAAVQEKISKLNERHTIQQILFGIESKLDQLVECLENVL